MSRTPWVPAFLLVLVVGLSGCAGDTRSTRSEETGAPPAAGTDDPRDRRWVSLRDVEVEVPSGWAADHPAVRPDCIQGGGARDPWARDVPDRPYVSVGSTNRPVPLIGCFPERDHDPAFGALPFDLWQPYVALTPLRADLDDQDATLREGEWEHRGWRLDRRTVGDVQVTVLAPPDDADLSARVHASARRVETTALGCETGSPVQAQVFAEPDGAAVPPAGQVSAVAVCEYSRIPGQAGLEGSRRIEGDEASALVRAIEQAPAGGGPDRPENCSADLYGERAIALRFFGEDSATEPLGEAFVYYDWCFGNGIVDATGTRALTRPTCSPLFAEPPITLWSAQAPVADVCGPLGAGQR